VSGALRAEVVWDAEAATFDDEPHHALEDPTLRSLWWDVLEPVLPGPPARVVDLGCGTGSVSVLLAEQGHEVVGVDISARMLALARAKARRRGARAAFVQGDAAAPPVAEADVVLTRHVVWALDDAATALDRWLGLLRPGGRLVLVEGLWFNGAGIASDDLVDLVRRPGLRVDVHALQDPLLWGRPIVDARYVLVART
jgi:SAM-dependent methyltransferase